MQNSLKAGKASAETASKGIIHPSLITSVCAFEGELVDLPHSLVALAPLHAER